MRKLDDLGRVVLPKELRRTLGLVDGDPIEIFTQGETVMLRRYEPLCVFCGESGRTPGEAGLQDLPGPRRHSRIGRWLPGCFAANVEIGRLTADTTLTTDSMVVELNQRLQKALLAYTPSQVALACEVSLPRLLLWRHGGYLRDHRDEMLQALGHLRHIDGWPTLPRCRGFRHWRKRPNRAPASPPVPTEAGHGAAAPRPPSACHLHCSDKGVGTEPSGLRLSWLWQWHQQKSPVGTMTSIACGSRRSWCDQADQEARLPQSCRCARVAVPGGRQGWKAQGTLLQCRGRPRVVPPGDWVPGDGFAWPVVAPIMSRFGTRVSPIDGVQRLHAGIDLAVCREPRSGPARPVRWLDPDTTPPMALWS